ncbi:hypothetical protein BJY24_006792 [Nocardia transvalensis]|uniref:Uncharacterized protein n=1 Tax=Nocardia transvalensis TaxID=37333 RepID=A0A7W9UML4_9NOCA|nr:hypothetical protein [Nocardia transvalensis]MBB5917880.1 hypothetical protein [Nocardia transvalensis]
MRGLEVRLARLIEDTRDLGREATVDRVSDLQRTLESLDRELAAVDRRPELGRLRREAGLLLADACARAVLARDFGDTRIPVPLSNAAGA